MTRRRCPGCNLHLPIDWTPRYCSETCWRRSAARRRRVAADRARRRRAMENHPTTARKEGS